MASQKPKVSKGPAIAPDPIVSGITVDRLVDTAFLAYNAARLREACRLFVEKMLEPDVTVGLTLSGALTPAGLGRSCLIPLLQNGFVDWIISTGANLYHDTHFGIGLTMHQGSVQRRRRRARNRDRPSSTSSSITTSPSTDAREVMRAPEFRQPMSTAEFHHRVGRYVLEREEAGQSGTRSWRRRTRRRAGYTRPGRQLDRHERG
jgi:deoxyhypusine synthase